MLSSLYLLPGKSMNDCPSFFAIWYRWFLLLWKEYPFMTKRFLLQVTVGGYNLPSLPIYLKHQHTISPFIPPQIMPIIIFVYINFRTKSAHTFLRLVNHLAFVTLKVSYLKSHQRGCQSVPYSMSWQTLSRFIIQNNLGKEKAGAPYVMPELSSFVKRSKLSCRYQLYYLEVESGSWRLPKPVDKRLSTCK